MVNKSLAAFNHRLRDSNAGLTSRALYYQRTKLFAVVFIKGVELNSSKTEKRNESYSRMSEENLYWSIAMGDWRTKIIDFRHLDIWLYHCTRPPAELQSINTNQIRMIV